MEVIDTIKVKQVPAAIFLLDAEKAFNLVVWEALLCILERFGFPSQILRFILNMYNHAQANLIINSPPAGTCKVRYPPGMSPLPCLFFVFLFIYFLY